MLAKKPDRNAPLLMLRKRKLRKKPERKRSKLAEPGGVSSGEGETKGSSEMTECELPVFYDHAEPVARKSILTNTCRYE